MKHEIIKSQGPLGIRTIDLTFLSETELAAEPPKFRLYLGTYFDVCIRKSRHFDVGTEIRINKNSTPRRDTPKSRRPPPAGLEMASDVRHDQETSHQ